MEQTALAVRRAGPKWEYLKYALYWPAFGAAFYILERLWRPERWYVMHCRLDDAIPFCEWFLIPYLFWFVFLVGMHLYTFFREPEEFRRLMRFIALTYTIALAIFILYPNCQHLRPAEFPRDNALTRFMGWFYQLDTNTNVCPSLHVVGSVAVALCAWRTRPFNSRGWRLVFSGTAALISVSTVFLKQHSAVDVLAGVLVCMAAYIPVYGQARVRRRLRAKDVSFG